jgi:hypothetical protein
VSEDKRFLDEMTVLSNIAKLVRIASQQHVVIETALCAGKYRTLSDASTLFCFLQVESGLVYRDGVPDVYWKVVRSLHPVVDFHGPDSEAAKEAKQILQDVIHIIKKAYVLAYKGRVSSIIHDICNVS